MYPAPPVISQVIRGRPLVRCPWRRPAFAAGLSEAGGATRRGPAGGGPLGVVRRQDGERWAPDRRRAGSGRSDASGPAGRRGGRSGGPSVERHRRRNDRAAAAASRPLRTSISAQPVQVLVTTSWYRTGYTTELTAVAATISAAAGRCAVCREVRQTAARPTSQTMYCGLMTLLVTVNSRTALSAASYGVAGVQRRARTR